MDFVQICPVCHKGVFHERLIQCPEHQDIDRLLRNVDINSFESYENIRMRDWVVYNSEEETTDSDDDEEFSETNPFEYYDNIRNQKWEVYVPEEEKEITDSDKDEKFMEASSFEYYENISTHKWVAYNPEEAEQTEDSDSDEELTESTDESEVEVKQQLDLDSDGAQFPSSPESLVNDLEEFVISYWKDGTPVFDDQKKAVEDVDLMRETFL